MSVPRSLLGRMTHIMRLGAAVVGPRRRSCPGPAVRGARRGRALPVHPPLIQSLGASPAQGGGPGAFFDHLLADAAGATPSDGAARRRRVRQRGPNLVAFLNTYLTRYVDGVVAPAGQVAVGHCVAARGLEAGERSVRRRRPMARHRTTPRGAPTRRQPVAAIGDCGRDAGIF